MMIAGTALTKPRLLAESWSRAATYDRRDA
jgi:hypothetical protein